MFWILIALFGFGFTFMRLGALSVLAQVLGAALAVAVGLLVLIGLWWTVRFVLARR
ncbi:MAG: hypothetical protein IPG57_06725 [Burkholderiales bacterium]|jgi:hypothetical protein|nr:hypothetical protein [Burkholderiales bacterium]MBP7520567.1 hypothetical protein [Leptothrix sp. (in: b-proteobacteria)]HQY10526.1 hypothetical protein [Burkholderiaceae bacterium]